MDRPTSQPVPPKSPTDLLRQFQEPSPQHFQILDVLLEGCLVGDRLSVPFGHHRAVVDPVGQTPKVFARLRRIAA